MSAEFDQDNLIGIFLAEVSDGIAAVARGLNPTDGALPTPPRIQEHFITAHRIRGAAALYGYGGIAALSERLEAMCERAGHTPDDAWPQAVGVMRETVQGLQMLVDAIRGGEGEDRATVDRYLILSEQWVSGDAVPEALALPMLAATVPPTEGGPHTDPVPGCSVVTAEYVAPPMDVDVLSEFLRKAAEYLAAIGGLIQVLQRKRDDADAVHRLFRAVRTLKQSACTAGFQVVGDLAHPMEASMIAVLEGRISLTDERLHRLAQGAALIRILVRRDLSSVAQLQREVPEVLELLNGLCDREVPAPPAGPLPEPASNKEIEVGTESSEAQSSQPSIVSDEYFLPQLDQEVLSYFVPEAQEYLETLEAGLLRLEAHPQNKDLIEQLFRTVHTLKGSAYTVGFQVIGDLVHHIEDFMGAVRDQRLRILPGHTDSIFRAIDVVRVLMQTDPHTVQAARAQFEAALMELQRLGFADEPDGSETGAAAGARVLRAVPQAGPGEEPATGHKHPEGTSRDEREVIRVSRARLEQLMNLVGELVIGRGRLEQRLLALERLSEQVVACKTRLVDAVQSFAGQHTITFRDAPSARGTPSARRSWGFDDSGIMNLGASDDSDNLARRIVEVSGDITESMMQLSGSIQHAHEDMKQLQHVTRNLRDEIARTRMIPIGTPFTRFRRAIRDLARASKKEVSLVVSGEHTPVDAGVVDRLVDPLVHLVRNAVYHGIELPADRVAKGKPAAGTVYLHAIHRGNSIMVEVGDDGAGLNLEKIREKAVTVGLAQPEQVRTMTDAEVLQFIFAPGFSTAETIGDQAGRGIGLDVVKQVVEGMHGRIEVQSVPDVGTKFTLHLPLTLLITTALVVRAGAEQYAIALSSIREVTLAADASLTKAEGRTLFALGEEMIEVQSLRHLLRGESAGIDSAMPIVIVRTAAGMMGLAVDELIGRHEIVIKSLGGLRPLEQSCFGGATIDPHGRVILVIDPSRLGSKKAGPPSVREQVSWRCPDRDDRYDRTGRSGG